MNKLALTVLSLMVVMTSQAVVISGYERPFAAAELEKLSPKVTVPIARRITMNQKDGSRRPTSFLLEEDTGIRCIMAPCPSEAKTFFQIYHIRKQRNGDVVYYAYVPRLEPDDEIFMPTPSRTLQLTDHSKNPRFDGQYTWMLKVFNVRVKSSLYGGNPEPVYTDQ